ncbi:hypothetical protein [Pseudomonas sp. PWP3-1b2]|uniref:hypothetical protein n=1 Tax=Pseudomonas sp. PWP3-1b2 TaxID=2804656 RepID=UPI003CE7E0EA
MSSAFILTFQQTELWLALVSRAQSEPDHVRLPLFSLLTLVQMTGFGVGMLLVGPFYIVWPPAQVIVLFHGLPLSTLMVIGVWLYRTRHRVPTKTTQLQ